MPILPPLKPMFDAMNSADMTDTNQPIAERRAMMYAKNLAVLATAITNLDIIFFCHVD